MKNRLQIIAGIMLMSFGVFAQTTTSLNMLSKGDFNGLSSLLADEIELTLIDDIDLCTKDEAILKLSGFFTSVQAKSWNEKHAGNTKSGDSSYTVGSFMDASKTKHRVFIAKDNVNGIDKIISIQIEK